MPITIQPTTLKYRGEDGVFHEVDCLKGDKGDPGNIIIDDTAGEGDTDKVWSADKLAGIDEDVSDLKNEINSKMDAPSIRGTKAQVLNIDNNGDEEWSDVKDLKLSVGAVNLFDSTTAEKNHRINTNTGESDSGGSDAMYASDFMPVTAGKTYDINFSYYSSSSYGMAFYKSDKTFLSGRKQAAGTSSSSDTFTFTVPSNAAYCRISITTARRDLAEVTVMESGSSGGSSETLGEVLEELQNKSTPYYTTITTFDESDLYTDTPGDGVTPQALCSDGSQYLWWALWRSDNANAILRKYDIDTNTVAVSKDNHSYGHANGMAYIPRTNELYICDMDSNGTIHVVDADTLEYKSSFTLNSILSDKVSWWEGVGAVAYNTKYEKVIYLLRGSADSNGVVRKGFAFFDKFGNFEKVIRTPYYGAESYAYGGIMSEGDVIYLALTRSENPKAGIVAYDMQGNEIYRTSWASYQHLESLAKAGNKFFFSYQNDMYSAKITVAETATTGAIAKAEVLSQYNYNGGNI